MRLGFQAAADAGDVDAAVVSGETAAGLMRREDFPAYRLTAAVKGLRTGGAEDSAGGLDVEPTGDEGSLRVRWRPALYADAALVSGIDR